MCLHGLPLVVVALVCVCLCVHPVLLPLSLKSVEDQTDNMKCSGMDETGNNQVRFLMNFCS